MSKLHNENKEIMKNQVIKVLNEEHGKKVIEYWKSRGIGTRGLVGGVTEEDSYHHIYYGVIHGRFDNYNLQEVNAAKAEIITLPEDNPYPKVMWVSDHNDRNWERRVVFMEKLGKYIAWSNAKTIKEAEKETHTSYWDCAKDIEEETPQEFTLQDISEGKATGVPSHLIRIKE